MFINPGLTLLQDWRFFFPLLPPKTIMKAGLAAVWCAFCRPSSSKSAPRLSVFNVLKCTSSSRYSPVHFLPAACPDRAAHPRKQRYFGDARSHNTRKNKGVRARECFHLCMHALLKCSSSPLLPHANCCVFDMMRRLPLDIRP